MLDTHRTDTRILEAIRHCRAGATVQEICEWIACNKLDPVSVDTVRRHMPGLIANSGVRKQPAFRQDRAVTVFFLKSGECVSDAEGAALRS